MLIRTDRPRWGLQRRTMLRGMGAAIALPWLEAMAPPTAHAQANTDPLRRFIAFYLPNGMVMPSFTPTMTGALVELPRLLAPLASVQQHINVITGLYNQAADRDRDIPGPHARGTASFLTGARILASESNIVNGVSVDLELGCEGGGAAGLCDAGYSCAYQTNISWAGPSTPMPKLTSPRVVFDRIMDSTAGPTDQVAQRRRRSVLDAVLTDIDRVNGRLGANDRRKIDEHLTGIRELERRIDQPAVVAACVLGDRPDDVDVNAVADVTAYVRTMIDVMVLACRCDRTRVMTFMMGNGGSPRGYGFLGIDGQHHGISHRPSRVAELELIDFWEMEQFAYLLRGLAAVEDSEGIGALDNSFVYCASELSDGAIHSRDNLPVIVAGRAGGLVGPGGRHLDVGPQPVANALLTAMTSIGMEDVRFADGGVPLDLT
jgi:Protein of unknown function (DUF1552)